MLSFRLYFVNTCIAGANADGFCYLFLVDWEGPEALEEQPNGVAQTPAQTTKTSLPSVKEEPTEKVKEEPEEPEEESSDEDSEDEYVAETAKAKGKVSSPLLRSREKVDQRVVCSGVPAVRLS